MFTGTQSPFNYDNDGLRTHSKSEELQYGNGICGVGSIGLKVDIVTTKEQRNKIAVNGYVQYRHNTSTKLFDPLDEYGMPETEKFEVERKYARLTLRFKKFHLSSASDSTLDDRLSEDT